MSWERTDGLGSIYSFSALPNHRNEAAASALYSSSTSQTALTTATSPRFDSIGAILRDVRRDNMGPIGNVSITPRPRTWRAPLMDRSKAPRRLSYSVSDSESAEASSDVIRRRRPASPLRPMQTEPAAPFSINVAGNHVPVHRHDSWRQTMKKPIYVELSGSAMKSVSSSATASAGTGVDEARYIGTNRLPPVRNISEQSTVTVNFSGLQREGDLDFDCGEKLIRSKPQRKQNVQPELSVSSATSDEHLGDESWLQSSDSSMLLSSRSASRSHSYSDVASERSSTSSDHLSAISASPSAFSASATSLSESDHDSVATATAAADSFVSSSAATLKSELSSDVSVTNSNTNTHTNSNSNTNSNTNTNTSSRYTESAVIGLGQTSEQWRKHGLFNGRQHNGARDEESSDFDDDLSQETRDSNSAAATDISSDSEAHVQAPLDGTELPPVAELWSTNDDAEDFQEASLKATPFDLESGGVQAIGREHSIELKALVWSMQKIKSFSNAFAIGCVAFLLVLVVVSILLPELPVFAAASVWFILSAMTYRELYDVSAALSGLLQMCTSLSGQSQAQMPLDSDDVDLEKLVREGVQNNLVRFKLVLVTDAGASGAFGLLLCITWLMSTASLSIISLLIGIVVMLMAIAGAFGALHQYRALSAELRTRLDRNV